MKPPLKFSIQIALLFTLGALLSACSAPAEITPPTIETGVNPEAWATVKAGPFVRGLHNEPASISADYQIMVTDVTNAQYANFLNQALQTGKVKQASEQILGPYPGDPYHGVKHEEKIDAKDWLLMPLNERGIKITKGGQGFTVKPGYENHPMVMVTWFGARAYCEFNSARLPSDAEWEKAARGSDDRPFPWGSGIERNQANYYNSRDPFESPFGKQGDTSPVGFYNGKTYSGYQTFNSASPYGLYDMAGNVWQWVGDIYEGSHMRTLRGGSKNDYAYNLRIWSRNSARPDYFSPSVGFRCVKETSK